MRLVADSQPVICEPMFKCPLVSLVASIILGILLVVAGLLDVLYSSAV